MGQTLPLQASPRCRWLAAALLLAAWLLGCAAPGPKPKPAPPIPPGARTPPAQALDQAMHEFYGAPYRSGGVTPAGVDCSGLVQAVYQRAGVKLPRTAAQQFHHGIPVNRQDLQFGDVIFFNSYCQNRQPKSFLAGIFAPAPAQAADICHNGIYVGQNRFVHANRDGVHVSRLDAEVWQTSFVGAKRYFGLEPHSGESAWVPPGAAAGSPPSPAASKPAKKPLVDYQDWGKEYDMFGDLPKDP